MPDKTAYPAYLNIPDLTNEAAAFAAKWWADQLKGHSWNNGEPIHGLFGRMLHVGLERLGVKKDT